MYNNQLKYDLHNNVNHYNYVYDDNDRFFLAPFLLGGIAGTALGYGISNNNNNMSYPVYPYPIYPLYTTYSTYPTYSTNNNYYY